MKKFLFFCTAVAALQLIACTSGKESSTSAKHEEDPDHSGFVFIHAKNKTVTIGTNKSRTKASEGPEMKVEFTYDFSIGKSEVTCKEFKDILKDEFEDLAVSVDCKNENLPISNVTYLDAVLFANAKSKAEKLDTAYTYLKASFDEDGHCTNLDALNFHPEVEAYRLPTEAEWVLAAKQGWDPKNSWNASNSDYKKQEVCTMGTNNVDLCDMEGNLKEWVNDWQGRFRDTTVTNYVGAPDGGKLGERVLKGGCYRSEVAVINTFSRGDVYNITSTSKTDYVGFRLAIGAIAKPTWMSDNGNAISSKISLLAGPSLIQKKTGSFNSKLAFRNHETGNLTYIDFSSGTISANEIKDTVSVFHPEISPNGNLVAFSSIYEGNSSPSSIYVRKLSTDNSKLIKLDVASAAIPRWRILENGDTAIVYVTSAGANTSESEFKVQSTWQVTFTNGKFGTPQKLFDGSYHGGLSNDNSLAVTGATLLRAKLTKGKSTIDTIWYNGEQACNASLAQDGSKRTAFLDFGSTTGREFVGEKYGVHERILIADSTGKLIQSISAPDEYSFDHSEWVSSNLIVASLANINEQHEKIVLIDITDSSVTDLVSGNELWHPNLWFQQNRSEIETSLDLDSAGVYYTVGGSEAALILRNKMEILWKYQNSKLVILGSSRSLNGTNTLALEDSLIAINLSNVPNSIYVSDYLFQNYLLNHFKELKYIVVSLDVDMWWKLENNSDDNFFYKEYKQYPGFVYDQDHNFWKDGYPQGLLEANHEAYNFDFYVNTYTPTRGSKFEPGGSWPSEAYVSYDSTWFDKSNKSFYANLDRLESMIKSAESREIILIGVIYPMNPNYKNTGSYGRYGIRRSIAPKLIENIALLSERYPNFILMDENKMGDHDYAIDEGHNDDHLNDKGAQHFTMRLDSLLKTLP